MEIQVKSFTLSTIITGIAAGQVIVITGIVTACVAIQVTTATLCILAVVVLTFVPADAALHIDFKPRVIEHQAPTITKAQDPTSDTINTPIALTPQETQQREQTQGMAGKPGPAPEANLLKAKLLSAAQNNRLPFVNFCGAKVAKDTIPPNLDTICQDIKLPAEQQELTTKEKLLIKRARQRQNRRALARVRKGASATSDTEETEETQTQKTDETEDNTQSFISELSERNIEDSEWKTVVHHKKASDAGKDKPTAPIKTITGSYNDDSGPRGTVIGKKINQRLAGRIKYAARDNQKKEEQEGCAEAF